MSIEKIVFDKAYDGPIDADIDWVAGGNFDGYIYKTTLRFTEEKNEVVLTTKIVDQSRYDGEEFDTNDIGTFSVSDKRAIVCQFPGFDMRGRFLGENCEFIAFSIWYNKDRTRTYSKVYTLTAD
ncbi:hypothetical protein SIO70_19255 [Chitinophaga sancti]|uniref:hypothetical protein n=1 Tax=Chitinophaga sancti TaxID=1004 RepID=UPI002A750939|nr:hypothetical protein [Chitinophaga sancti]WPQ60489.1 hypothetical protein SIO70_19255 [Chitinophaga sancti]